MNIRRIFDRCSIFKSTFYLDTMKLVRGFINKGDLLLDMGSGTAPYSSPLECIAIALDRDEAPINQITARRGLYSLVGDAQTLPFKDLTFNKVLMTEVLEHIGDRDKCLREIARVLADDGELLLTTPNALCAPLDRSYRIGHVIHYAEDELSSLLGRYFDHVNIKKRFRWFKLLDLQYIFWDKWLVNKKNFHFYILNLIAAAFYNTIFPIERLFFKGRYNFIVRCRLPKR